MVLITTQLLTELDGLLDWLSLMFRCWIRSYRVGLSGDG